VSAPGADAGAADAAAAVGELRILVHRLADEVAAFRRRALQSETRVRELEAELASRDAAAAAVPPGTGEPLAPEDLARLHQVEAENAELRQRLEQAADRTRQLLERARFLRQQQGEGTP
jgi:hypothetical protein